MSEELYKKEAIEIVAKKVVNHLNTSGIREQQALIIKLLEQVPPDFLLALDFSYDAADVVEVPRGE